MSPLNASSINSFPEVPGYRIVEQIHRGSRTSVYRAIQHHSQRLVILKALHSSYPTFSELIQFRNQYAITQNLDVPGIVQP